MNGMQKESLTITTYVATVFLSAFLLFQVQPIIAKDILPLFGGSSSVWTICMLFFQTLLLAGYAYAHMLDRCLSQRGQAVTHAIILIIAVSFLPITPDHGRSVLEHSPAANILLLLFVSVGFPYFVLSSTGTLLQAWFRQLHSNRSPYPLYAVSNGGSLLALLSYPFLVEPLTTTDTQMTFWSWGFMAFVLLCCCSAIIFASDAKPSTTQTHSTDDNQPIRHPASRIQWVILPACASLLLLAVTNHITQDVASVPFLWIVPLSLYLLSFILCFESDRWYRRGLYGTAFLLVLIAVCLDLYHPYSLHLLAQIALYNAFLFITCMLCHGELAYLRPDARHLTLFYLSIASGGAAGGIFVGLVAPMLFNYYVELQLGIVICLLLVPAACFFDPASSLYGGRPVWAWGIYCLLAALLIAFLYLSLGVKNSNAVESIRNFYGVLRVSDNQRDDQIVRSLQHGRIVHGAQYMGSQRHQWPTTYYGATSGVGRAFSINRNHKRHVGVLGLGVGTLAAYGRLGDNYRFYEINPAVVRIARKEFFYLAESKADIVIIQGDALLTMASEKSQGYDILALDAFSGDAVPVHLLTREAFAIYSSHLKQDGIICVNITNKYLDLRPVIRAQADVLGREALFIDSIANDKKGIVRAQWMVLTTNQHLIDQLKQDPGYRPRDHSIKPLLWTNKYSNIFSILKY